MSLPPLEIREASTQAIADGIRRYVPAGVGILAIGIPTCVLAAFVHFALGVSSAVTIGASMVPAGIAHIIRSTLLR
jgi:hypothetical protein